ncbi:hypothetical protein GGE08_002386 [Muricauda sp. ARW1Y1]|nr:hypothetical protein [Muricauda sp. ARW1Y1]
MKPNNNGIIRTSDIIVYIQFSSFLSKKNDPKKESLYIIKLNQIYSNMMNSDLRFN